MNIMNIWRKYSKIFIVVVFDWWGSRWLPPTPSFYSSELSLKMMGCLSKENKIFLNKEKSDPRALSFLRDTHPLKYPMLPGHWVSITWDPSIPCISPAPCPGHTHECPDRGPHLPFLGLHLSPSFPPSDKPKDLRAEGEGVLSQPWG